MDGLNLVPTLGPTLAVVLACLALACGDDAGGDGSQDTTGTTTSGTDTLTPSTSGGSTSLVDSSTGGSSASTGGESTSGSSSDGSTDDDSTGTTGPGVDPIERGQYLVDHVATCGVCHTPLDAMGQPDMTRYLAGNPDLFDLDPMDPALGLLPVPNLTPHETGLAGWTANQIRAAFQDGIDNEGNALAFVMPYYAFHNLTDDDADAVVAYLQSIDPVDNAIPERQTLPFPVEFPVQPVPWDQVPESTLTEDHPDYEAAQLGRYLAGAVGGCHECHTPLSVGPVPVDMALSFAGGRPVGPILSTNITPHANGIASYTVQDVVNVLLDGVEVGGDGICPPMPVGPMGGYAGLTEEDAEAIGIYLTTLAPIDNGVFGECSP